MTICNISTKPTGHVYFVRMSEDVIKIGFSSCLPERMKTYQRNSAGNAQLLFAVPGCERREKALHSHFVGFRIAKKKFGAPNLRSAPEHFRIPENVLIETMEAMSKEPGFIREAGKPMAICNVKISREMHLVLKTISNHGGLTIQQIISEAISQYIDRVDAKIKTPYRRKAAQ